MQEKVFLAGATGAIGRMLVPLLVEGGYQVYGSTRRPERAAQLRAQGAQAVLVDVFDAATLREVLCTIAPEIVVHQLTDLPATLDPATLGDALRRNARIRTEGTRHLVAAARAAGARHLVAQSIGWAYAPGLLPHVEDDALDLEAQGDRRTTVQGVAALERAVLQAEGLTGCVLRYGRLYGPGTASATAPVGCALHVEAAAWAARLAVDAHAGGIFNIAEPGGELCTARAQRVLGWTPALRLEAAAPCLG